MRSICSASMAAISGGQDRQPFADRHVYGGTKNYPQSPDPLIVVQLAAIRVGPVDSRDRFPRIEFVFRRFAPFGIDESIPPAKAVLQSCRAACSRRRTDDIPEV